MRNGRNSDSSAGHFCPQLHTYDSSVRSVELVAGREAGPAGRVAGLDRHRVGRVLPQPGQLVEKGETVAARVQRHLQLLPHRAVLGVLHTEN